MNVTSQIRESGEQYKNSIIEQKNRIERKQNETTKTGQKNEQHIKEYSEQPTTGTWIATLK